MPVVLIIIAAALIASGIRGTYKQLGALIVGDFTGNTQSGAGFSSGAASGGAQTPQTFFTWLIAVGCVGIIGYVPQLQRFSRVFLALIIVACVLKQGTGLFAQFTSALQGAQAGTPVTPPGQTIDAGQATSQSDGLALNTASVSSPIAALGSVTGALGIGGAAASGALGPLTTLFNTTGTTQAAKSAGFSPGAASGNDAPLVSGSTQGSTTIPTSVLDAAKAALGF